MTLALGTMGFVSPVGAQESQVLDPSAITDGRQLYDLGCASCHGADGAGQTEDRVAFEDPLPDFGDCSFASREPDADWVTVAHEGGPVRGFSEVMPAFGEAFSEEQLQAIIEYTRTFCTDGRWPRGELNLPRPIFTEKAYPEDEAVWTILVAADGPGSVINEFVYENRFGPRSQIEIKLPFGTQELVGADQSGDWNAGIGDIGVGLKHAFFHSLESGSIVSGNLEVKLPTGSEKNGWGAGTTIFEPFFSFGQILPASLFLHAQGGVELSTNTDKASNEVFWRGVIGGSWSQNRFGRSWAPMMEVLGASELGDGGTDWSLVPQLQVTLNRRQHVMLNLGVLFPLNEADSRSTRLIMYVLWDWFDGGLFDGW